MPIPVRKITWILIGFMLLLNAAHLWVNLAPPISPTGFRYDSLISAFHLENEANIPNWYSTVLLFAIALAALVIRRLQKQPRWGFFWPVFAGFFALLSLEEAADLREVIYHTIFVKSFLVCAPLGSYSSACVWVSSFSSSGLTAARGCGSGRACSCCWAGRSAGSTCRSTWQWGRARLLPEF